MAGANYSSPSQPFSYRKLAGGLNSTASPTSLEDNESSDLQNIDFDITGQFHKRGGSTLLNTTAFNSGATFNGLYWFEKSDGTKYLLGTCGSKLGVATSLTQASTPFNDRTGALTFTAGNNNQQSFATMLDTVLGTNGVDLPWQCVGSSNAVVIAGIAGGGSAPTITTAKYVEVFSNYAFLANVTSSGTYQGSRIHWSSIDSISTWSASDFRDVNKADGQVITGLKKLGQSLVIFKRHSIWVAQFTGDSDLPFVFTQTPSTVGAVSGYSIQEVQNGLVFLADDGFYYFDGNNSYKISARVRNTLNSFNNNRFPQCCSVYSNTNNRYISSFSNSADSTHSKQITWDSLNNAFSVYKGLNANCFARTYISGVETIFFGDYSGFVRQMDTGTSDHDNSNVAQAIDCYYYTKWFDFGDMISKKATPQVSIFYEFTTGTMTFAYSYDFEQADSYTQTFSMSAGSSLYGTAMYDVDTYAGSGGNVNPRHLTGRGKVVRFKFANANVGEDMIIDGFAVFANAESNVK